MTTRDAAGYLCRTPALRSPLPPASRMRAIRRVVLPLAAIAVAVAVAACGPGGDASRDGATTVSAATDTAATATAAADTAAVDTAVADTAAMDTAVARTPESDPWLFEGIPNFEDLVALRDGDWLVVLASAARDGAPPAPTIVRAADARIAAVQQRAWNARLVPFAVPSERLPAFAPGLVVLVLGPFARADAERRLADARRVAPDAYLKAGW